IAKKQPGKSKREKDQGMGEYKYGQKQNEDQRGSPSLFGMKAKISYQGEQKGRAQIKLRKMPVKIMAGKQAEIYQQAERHTVVSHRPANSITNRIDQGKR